MNSLCISGFCKDCLLLVIPNSPYCQHVPIQLGMIHIVQALAIATKGELENPDWKWKRGQIAALLAAKASKVMPPIPITTANITVKLTKKVIIQPFATIHVTGLCKVPFMTQGADVMVEAREEPFSDSVTNVNSYSYIKQGSTWVPLGL